ncbi:sensor histidine kinase [Rhodocista pekingensis]|uniref:histidine kinase n=1 Tax=Rhodocista pekingensis TaxID=201185 RepID=A0ABW2KNV2_9PROT
MQLVADIGGRRLRALSQIRQSVAIAGIAALLLALFAMFHWVVRSEEWVNHTHRVKLAIERALAGLAAAEAADRRFLITDDPEALEPRTRALAGARDAAARVATLTADNPVQHQRARDLAALVERHIAYLDTTLELERQGRDQDVREYIRTGPGLRAMAEIIARSAAMQAEEDRLLVARSERVARLQTAFTLTGLILGIGCMALVMATQRRDREIMGGLAEALHDRTILLREINHRVGNSLQMVASLVKLQSAAGDAVARAALRKAEGRILSVGEAHKHLHRTGAIETIDIADYLAALVANLREQIPDGAACLRLDAVSVAVPVEQAVSLGLIVNELVTNAAEHAYAPGDAAVIEVVLRREAGGFRLIVRDHGRGLPDGAGNPSGGGLGMLLLYSLTGQLAGSLRFQSGARGTTAIIEFPAQATEAGA